MVVTAYSYQTGPVYFSPGPCPASSGSALDSRKASCSVFSPSRTGPACGPRYSAAALISMTADRVMTSTAGMSASSRTAEPSRSPVLGRSVMPARLACATVPAYARDSKWSPTPTADHIGAAVRSQASVPVLVGFGPCFKQGLSVRNEQSADGVDS